MEPFCCRLIHYTVNIFIWRSLLQTVDVQQITDVDAILLSGSFFFSPAVEMDLSAETTTDADAVAAETTAAG